MMAIILAVSGCGRSTGIYNSLEEARAAIEDGFVPACLPPSTYEVRDAHDLETFTGKGTFRFAPADFGFLVTKTKPVSERQVLSEEQKALQQEGYIFRKAESMNSYWLLAVKENGSGAYWLQDVVW